MTRTETALRALKAILVHAALPAVRRNESQDRAFEALGGGSERAVLALYDGEAVDVVALMGQPPDDSFEITHAAELEWLVADLDETVREDTFDAGLEAIGGLVKANRTLGGAVSDCRIVEPPTRDLDLAGSRVVKTAVIRIHLEFTSPEPF